MAHIYVGRVGVPGDSHDASEDNRMIDTDDAATRYMQDCAESNKPARLMFCDLTRDEQDRSLIKMAVYRSRHTNLREPLLRFRDDCGTLHLRISPHLRNNILMIVSEREIPDSDLAKFGAGMVRVNPSGQNGDRAECWTYQKVLDPLGA